MIHYDTLCIFKLHLIATFCGQKTRNAIRIPVKVSIMGLAWVWHLLALQQARMESLCCTRDLGLHLIRKRGKKGRSCLSYRYHRHCVIQFADIDREYIRYLGWDGRIVSHSCRHVCCLCFDKLRIMWSTRWMFLGIFKLPACLGLQRRTSCQTLKHFSGRGSEVA